MAGDESGTVTIVLIAAGCIVGVLLVSFAAYMITQKCKNKNQDNSGERAFLLGINTEGTVTSTKDKWPFGDLDRSGVARILKWLKEVVTPSSVIDDGNSSMFEHQTLLGEDDGLSTPTHRYSPRVSNVSQVGSSREEVDDGRLVDDDRE
eukprot:GILI01016697.1.p1 GENE.GILI01016697.1~~GILI01016697.1.p1  ORF type:complete len:149 (+),score=3.31 GILI01016697.1:27-473(+)